MKYLILLFLAFPIFFTIWAKFFLFTPSERLLVEAQKFFFIPKLPVPQEGSTSRKLCLLFYRSIGVALLLFSVSIVIDILKFIREL